MAATRPPGQLALLEAARLEFAERGFGSASIRDIAARAGMSLSAMYHYYAGKQELLAALLEEGMQTYFQAVEGALEQVGDAPADRLAAVVAATTRFRCEHSTRSSLLLHEERSLDAEQQARYRLRLAESTNLFRRAVDDGVAAGVFLTPYPDEARRAVIAMCNAVAQWFDPDGPMPLDELIDRHVALALTIVEYRAPQSWRALRGARNGAGEPG